MQQNVKISIIVPIYNVEKYIYTCLESIMSQSFSEYEVLMVDDGSTDTSGDIAKSFTKDKRFQYIYQENSGVSVARNNGLEHAKGEWIAFVDSDDALTEEYLYTLFNNVDDTTDIVCCGCKYYDNGQTHSVSFYPEKTLFTDLKIEMPDYAIKPKRELLLLLMNNQYKTKQKRRTAIGVPWGKLYRASLLRDNQLSFNAEQKRLQDNIFNMMVFEKAKTIKYIDEMLYIYTVDHINSYRMKYDSRAPHYYYLLFQLRRDFLKSRDLFKDDEIREAYYCEVLKYSGNIFKQYYLNRDNPSSKKALAIEMKKYFSDELYKDVIINSPLCYRKVKLILAHSGNYKLLSFMDCFVDTYMRFIRRFKRRK